MTVSPDGSAVYVTSEEDGVVDVVDARSFAVLALPVPPRPRAVAFSPDGARAFVSAEQGAAVASSTRGRARPCAESTSR